MVPPSSTVLLPIFNCFIISTCNIKISTLYKYIFISTRLHLGCKDPNNDNYWEYWRLELEGIGRSNSNEKSLETSKSLPSTHISGKYLRCNDLILVGYRLNEPKWKFEDTLHF